MFGTLLACVHTYYTSASRLTTLTRISTYGVPRMEDEVGINLLAMNKCIEYIKAMSSSTHLQGTYLPD